MSCDHESWCDRKPYVCSITENFFQNRRTFEKIFIVDGSHGPSHFSCVGFQSKFFENPKKKKCFWCQKWIFTKNLKNHFMKCSLWLQQILKLLMNSEGASRKGKSFKSWKEAQRTIFYLYFNSESCEKLIFAVVQWFLQFWRISLHETQKYTSKQYMCTLFETFDSSKVLKIAVIIRNISWNDFSNFLWKSILDIYRHFFDVQKILTRNPHMKNLMNHDFDRRESFFQKSYDCKNIFWNTKNIGLSVAPTLMITWRLEQKLRRFFETFSPHPYPPVT